MRKILKDEKTLRKNSDQWTMVSGEPINGVRGEASKNTRI
jgi:hypothetical protein